MAEWSIAAVLKTVEGNTSGGLNPSFSAYTIKIKFCNMKSLKDILSKKHYKLPNYCFYNTIEEFCDINGIIIDDLTEDQANYYYDNLYSDFHERSYSGHTFMIEESLKSHSIESVVKKLYKVLPSEYDINIESKSGVDKSGLITITVPLNNELVNRFSLHTCYLKSSKLSDKVYDIIDFMLYNVTYVELNESNYKYTIYIEPVYTKNVEDLVKKNGNIVYHVTHKNNLNSVLKSGLRPKVGKTPYEDTDKGYRYFPERLFVVNNSKNIKTDLKQIILDKQLKDGEYIILKINVKKHNISFFVDDASDTENCFYTLESIPPSLITTYFNIDELPE